MLNDTYHRSILNFAISHGARKFLTVCLKDEEPARTSHVRQMQWRLASDLVVIMTPEHRLFRRRANQARSSVVRAGLVYKSKPLVHVSLTGKKLCPLNILLQQSIPSTLDHLDTQTTERLPLLARCPESGQKRRPRPKRQLHYEAFRCKGFNHSQSQVNDRSDKGERLTKPEF